MLPLVSPHVRRSLLPVLGLALGLVLGGVALSVPAAHAQDSSGGSSGRACVLASGLLLPDGWETNEGILRVRCVDGKLVIVGLATVPVSRPGAGAVMPVGAGAATLAR